MRIGIGLTAVLGSMAVLTTAIAQQYVAPNLEIDNITRVKPCTPGLPNDYILIGPGGTRLLRFDWPIARILIDDPDILDAGEVRENSILLKAGRWGVTRLIVQGRKVAEVVELMEKRPTQERRALEINDRLLFHALVGVGIRIVAGGTGTGTTPVSAARSYDCTPVCIFTPGREPREPDQIIEYRGTGQPPPPAPPPPPSR